MTNQEKMKDVERQIAEELKNFNAEKFDAPLPKGFVELYLKSFMATPPSVHRLMTVNVKKVTEKKESELNNQEVGIMVNSISSVAPESLYPSTAEALKMMEKIDDLRMDYNLKVRAIEGALAEKKERLMSLAGVNLGNSKLVSV